MRLYHSFFFMSVITSLTIHVSAQNVLSLKETVQLTKKSNPDLKVVSYNMNAAQADITSAKIRPNLFFNTQLLHIANANNRADGTSWGNSVNTQYWWQVTKRFQLPTQRSSRIDLSKKTLIQSKLDYNEASRNVYLDAANKWLDVWAAKVNLDILKKGKVNVDSLVEINLIRLKDQVITSTDLLRTQLLQQQYQRDIITANQNYINELQRLKYMLGTSDSISVDLADTTFNNIDLSSDSLVELGSHLRTDILSAKNAIDVSASNIKLQRSFAYPQPEAGMIWNPQNKVSYLGFYGTVEIPLFNRNQGQREKAEVLKLKTEENLRATERQAETEVNTSYRNYVVQKESLKSFEKNLVQAETILNNVRYSYLKGSTSIIDLLEAQRSWLDTQQRYYGTMEYLRRSYVQLLYATGIINQLAE